MWVFLQKLVYFLHIWTFTDDDEFGFYVFLNIFKDFQNIFNSFHRTQIGYVDQDFFVISGELPPAAFIKVIKFCIIDEIGDNFNFFFNVENL